jgi:hypothetical protein
MPCSSSIFLHTPCSSTIFLHTPCSSTIFFFTPGVFHIESSGDAEITPTTNDSTIVTNNQEYEMNTLPELGTITESRSLENELLKISKCPIVFNVNINK